MPSFDEMWDDSQSSKPKKQLTKSQEWFAQNPATRFVGGITGGIHNIGLGLEQTGAELGQRLGLVKPETVNALRQQAEADRATMTALKESGGGKAGFGNAASWGEAIGEAAPTMAVPALRATTFPRAVAGGALLGGGLGLTAPLAPNESRRSSALEGALLGGAVGGLTKGAIQGAKALPGVARNIEGRVAGAIERRLDPATPKTEVDLAIEKSLRKAAPVAPGKYKTAKARSAAHANNAEAVKDVYRLRDEVELPDATGRAVTGRAPKTQEELESGLSQGMQRIMSATDEIAKSAEGQNLRLVPDETISELKKVRLSAGYTQRQVDQANALANELATAAKESGGGLSPSAALRRMTALNNDIKAIFTGKNTSGDSPEVLALAANHFRRQLNNMMAPVEGESGAFSQTRQSWGRMSGLHEDVLRNLEMRANKTAGGGISVFDILSAEQMAQAVTKGQPGKAATAGGSYLVGRAFKWFNGPDRAVKNMFKAVEGSEKGAKITLPSAQDLPPAPKMMRDPSTGQMIPATGFEGQRAPLNLVELNIPKVRDPSTGAMVPSRQASGPRKPLNLPEGRPEADTRPRKPLNLPEGRPEADTRPRKPLNLPEGTPVPDTQIVRRGNLGAETGGYGEMVAKPAPKKAEERITRKALKELAADRPGITAEEILNLLGTER